MGKETPSFCTAEASDVCEKYITKKTDLHFSLFVDFLNKILTLLLFYGIFITKMVAAFSFLRNLRCPI